MTKGDSDLTKKGNWKSLIPETWALEGEKEGRREGVCS